MEEMVEALDCGHEKIDEDCADCWLAILDDMDEDTTCVSLEEDNEFCDTVYACEDVCADISDEDLDECEDEGDLLIQCLEDAYPLTEGEACPGLCEEQKKKKSNKKKKKKKKSDEKSSEKTKKKKKSEKKDKKNRSGGEYDNFPCADLWITAVECGKRKIDKDCGKCLLEVGSGLEIDSTCNDLEENGACDCFAADGPCEEDADLTPCQDEFDEFLDCESEQNGGDGTCPDLCMDKKTSFFGIMM